MANLTPEQLREKYKSLPQDVQDAIFAVDSANVIQEIGKKYHLAVDKVGELADEVGLLMLGITHPKEFISNVTQRLKIDKETAHNITKEINEKIFSKVRESLKKIHDIEESTEELKEEIGKIPKQPEIEIEGKEEIGKKPQETIESKEEIMKVIENPEDIPDIIKGKMSPEVFSKPPEVSEHKAPTFKPEEVGSSQYAGSDPYREPIE